MPLRNVVASTLTTAHSGDPDQHVGEGDQAARHATLRHDGAGKHEERNGQHRNLADPVGDFQHHGFERNADVERAGDGSERK